MSAVRNLLLASFFIVVLCGSVGAQGSFRDAQEPTHTLMGIRLVGPSPLPDEEFADLFGTYVGRPVTFSELQDLAYAIEEMHVSRGYPLVIAYFPEQEIEDGVIDLAVIVGRYGAIKIENRSRLRGHVAQRALQGILPGDPVYAPTLDDRVERLGSLPGVAAWSAFAVGQRAGETDLEIHIKDTKVWDGSASVSATGSPFGETLSANLSATASNRFGLGEQLTGSISTDRRSTASGRVAFDLPVGAAPYLSTVGIRVGEPLLAHGRVRRFGGRRGKCDRCRHRTDVARQSRVGA